jgi:hypothetical protein
MRSERISYLGYVYRYVYIIQKQMVRTGLSWWLLLLSFVRLIDVILCDSEVIYLLDLFRYNAAKAAHETCPSLRELICLCVHLVSLDTNPIISRGLHRHIVQSDDGG